VTHYAQRTTANTGHLELHLCKKVNKLQWYLVFSSPLVKIVRLLNLASLTFPVYNSK